MATFPSLIAEVAKLSAAAAKAGMKFSFRERFVLASVQAYVDGKVPGASIVASGKRTATASATQVVTVSGVLATDNVQATIESQAGTVSLIKATPTANTVTIVADAAFAASDVISYVVLRTV